MSLVLRPYQDRAVESIYRHIQTRDDNPCVVVPTGGGKTPVIARVCRDAVEEWSGKVVILAHVKELLEQSYKHLERDAPGLAVGLYSAGLGSRDTGYPVTITGIASAYRNVESFQPANLIIVDEAHRIPPDGEGMYRTFLAGMKAKNSNVRLIGFTATPYRTSTGAICSKDNLLNKICFEVGVRELIMNGYLSKLVTRGGSVDTDFRSVPVTRGEFAQAELEALMSEDFTVATAVLDILHRAKGRKKILIFASGVDHAKKIATFLREDADGRAGTVGEIYGETDADERAELVRRFRDGDLRCLVNVEVLTLGFDAPNVDCVALLRATMSPGLYYQMVGRGFRIAPGKEDCLILDFGGNVIRHGPVDVLAPEERKGQSDADGSMSAKKCPECCLIVPAGILACPECGHEFPKREARHEGESYGGDVLAPEIVDVLDVSYGLHDKKEIPSLRVNYLVGRVGEQGVWLSEWVCLQHTGWARDKAAGWWSRRAGSGPVPRTIEEALDQVDRLARPLQLKVNYRGRYPEILGYRFTNEAARTAAS